MNTTEILTKELVNFIEKLRLADYNIGATQYIAAQDLILILAAQAKLPSELPKLRLFLAPILCHSPTEQAEFQFHFNQWINKFNPTKILADTACANKAKTVDEQAPIKVSYRIPEPKPEPKLEPEKIKKYNTLWKWVFIISTIVAVISAIVFILNM